MQSVMPLACFLSMIRPPGIEFENSLLQIAPVDKLKCPFVKDHNDITFQLFTKHNPTVFDELIIGDDDKLLGSHMNFQDTTVLYFHAFMEMPDQNSGAMIRQAYMLRGDTNVIMVDASRLEAGPWYIKAAENTWYIGKMAAELIDFLVSRGLNLKRTHLVGHSLGAQAAGVAGGHLKSGLVARITGLDPACPLFNRVPLSQKLDPSDAEFVDVIHTDAGIFGVKENVGHADFYPNGGISPQPGCELEVVIPQQMLLNKCDNKTIPQDYYTFYLKPKNYTEHTENNTMSPESTFTFNKTKPGNKKTKKYNENLNFQQIFRYYSNIRTLNSIIHRLKDLAIEQDSDNSQSERLHVFKRQKRFTLPFFKPTQATQSENFLFRMLEFLFKNRRTIVPVFTVLREVSTLVKSANGELNHVTKEQNNYIGSATPPSLLPVTYTLELGNESRVKSLVKRLLGLAPKGDRLTIAGTGKK